MFVEVCLKHLLGVTSIGGPGLIEEFSQITTANQSVRRRKRKFLQWTRATAALQEVVVPVLTAALPLLAKLRRPQLLLDDRRLQAGCLPLDARNVLTATDVEE